MVRIDLTPEQLRAVVNLVGKHVSETNERNTPLFVAERKLDSALMEHEARATHQVTISIALDNPSEMGDNAPRTFHEAARIILTARDAPLPAGAITRIEPEGEQC